MPRILFFRITAWLIFLIAMPFTALAAADWDAVAEDTIAGYGTEIELRGDPGTKVYVIVESPGGAEMEPAAKTDTKGKAFVELTAEETEEAGVYNVTIENRDGDLLAKTSFEVFPDAPAKLTIEPESNEIKKGEEVIVNAGIFDQYDNPLSGRPLVMLSSDGEVEKIDAETGDDGFAAFSFIPDSSPESVVVVVDLLAETEREFTLEISGGSERKPKSSRFSASLLDEYDRKEDDNPAGRQYGFVDHFDIVIDNPDPVQQVNQAYGISIIALDRYDRQVKDYVGRVVLETTDTLASIPQSDVRFRASDMGRVDLPLSIMFGTPGEHKLFVEDQDDEDIRGILSTLWVVSHDAVPQRGSIIVESHKGTQTLTSRHVNISGTAPAYINLDLFANENLLKAGSSDENGRFSFSVALDAAQAKHELIVREGEGGLDRVSNPFTIIVDEAPPTIQDFVLLPASAAPGEPVKVTVTTGAGESVEVILDQMTPVQLAEKGEVSDGMSEYEASFAAPGDPGGHAVTVIVRDQAGNEFKQSKQLMVETGGLEVVKDVKAVTQDQDVILSWSPVPGAVGYRVYSGESPTNLTNHISTNSAATSVRLTGLEGGQVKHFSVTALDAQGNESIDQSKMIAAEPRGSLFDVQLFGKINGAHMQWNAPPGANIKNYIVQYGVQPNAYTETQSIAAGSSQFEFADLINGVSYFVLLSAELSDGTILTDRVASSVVAGQAGQPGMHLAQYDPLPGNIGGSPPGVHGTPTNPGDVPSTGLPIWLWSVIIIFGASTATFFHLSPRRTLSQNLKKAQTDHSS